MLRTTSRGLTDACRRTSATSTFAPPTRLGRYRTTGTRSAFPLWRCRSSPITRSKSRPSDMRSTSRYGDRDRSSSLIGLHGGNSTERRRRTTRTTRRPGIRHQKAGPSGRGTTRHAPRTWLLWRRETRNHGNGRSRRRQKRVGSTIPAVGVGHMFAGREPSTSSEFRFMAPPKTMARHIDVNICETYNCLPRLRETMPL
jgi:hypothetical protein